VKIPVVDLSECIRCGVCQDVCPQVFTLNDAGFVEVAELSDYPEAEVQEAMRDCPTDCISWETC
jgi:ferredoxin